MEIAKILVNQTTGHCMTRRRIPARLVGGTVSVEFDDPIWDRLVKTVVFRGTEVKAAEEFDGKTAVIPWEVLEHPGPYLFFGIWGSDPDSALQLPLIEVRIGLIEDATDPTADPGTDPTLPIWAQLQQDVEALKKNGVGGENEIFLATYGETTVDELWAAAQEGKTCIVQQGNFYFLATSVTASRAVFSGNINGTLVTILCNSDGWSRTNITLEEAISEKSTHLQHPTSKAVYDYVQEYGGDAAQSDWNAAEGEPGHILNRPFYSEGEGRVEILPECQPPFDEEEAVFWVIENAPVFTVGETYIVNWNGTEYTCEAQDLSVLQAGAVAIGDCSMFAEFDPNLTGNGEPFVAVNVNDIVMINPWDGTNELTVSIYRGGGVIHKLDNKYLDLAWLPIRLKGLLTLFEETIHFGSSGMKDYMGAIPFVIKNGETYIVNWNGTEYTCEAKPSKYVYHLGEINGFAIGNESLYKSEPGDDTGEPFLFFMAGISTKENGSMFVYSSEGDADIDTLVSIYDDAAVPNKIPAEFLPDDIGAVKTVNGVAPDENGNVEITIPDSGGNVEFQTDETLTLKDGVLSVNTTNNMEQDNTLPITSAGVFATVGNIEALLKTI